MIAIIIKKVESAIGRELSKFEREELEEYWMSGKWSLNGLIAWFKKN